MKPKEKSADLSHVQAAIYGAALSLDAFLVNGIQYGILQQSVFNGFIEKPAGNLLRDLATLESEARHAPISSQLKVAQLLAKLRAQYQQVIDIVAELVTFRNLPWQQVHSKVLQIPLLRGDCVKSIQELEKGLGTEQPFYQSRPDHLTAAVNVFLADLERQFEAEWTAAHAAMNATT